MIYLDNASTTKPSKSVVEVINEYLINQWYNPSSVYSVSSNIRKKVEEAREHIAQFVGAYNDEIYFTSCGSESNCWAIKGFVDYWTFRTDKVIVITSTIEHKSIMECVENLNCEIEFVPVDELGFVNCDMLEKLLQKYSADSYKILVSIQYANNEIGTIQEVKNLSTLIHEYNAVFHTDAVQAFGNEYIDVKSKGIDMMSVSGHKVHAPKGIGFLYIDNNIVSQIRPLVYGSQNYGMRGGTENVPYIMGFYKAIDEFKSLTIDDHLRVSSYREYLISCLIDMGCVVNGDEFSRLKNNVSVILPEGISSEKIILALDSSDIYVSAGSACNSRSTDVSYVLKSIGLTDDEAMRTLRITIGYDTTDDEVTLFIDEFNRAIKIIKMEQMFLNGGRNVIG